MRYNYDNSVNMRYVGIPVFPGAFLPPTLKCEINCCRIEHVSYKTNMFQSCVVSASKHRKIQTQRVSGVASFITIDELL